MWEYKTVAFQTFAWMGMMKNGEIDAMLNGLGKENWELISSDGASLPKFVIYTFKRPLNQ